MTSDNKKRVGFTAGIAYFIEGFSWIRRPGLFRYVVIPLSVNVLFFTGLIWVYLHYLAKLTLFINQHMPTWLHWIDWIIYPFFLLIIFVILSYSFSLMANLIAAPFNSFLAEKTELIATGRAVQSDALLVQLKNAPGMIGRQLHFIVYYLLRAIPVLLLFLIPFMHLIAGFIWFVFNAHMMVLQYVDYHMDNHHVPFREMRAIISQNRSMALGFGSAVVVATFIPILNFFVMPAAVIGATLMVIEHKWAGDFLARQKKVVQSRKG